MRKEFYFKKKLSSSMNNVVQEGTKPITDCCQEQQKNKMHGIFFNVYKKTELSESSLWGGDICFMWVEFPPSGFWIIEFNLSVKKKKDTKEYLEDLFIFNKGSSPQPHCKTLRPKLHHVCYFKRLAFPWKFNFVKFHPLFCFPFQ